MRAYAPVVSFRPLIALLTALAVLFAPSLAPVAAASVGPADHHEQMMKTGHCDSMSQDEEDKAADKSCCVQMCMGVAAALTSPAGSQVLLRSLQTPALESFFGGTPAEIATPPPRVA